VLKLRQRNRNKKKSLFLAKRHLGVDLEAQLGGSPKRWKEDKRKYKVCSSHRRTVSHLVGREEDDIGRGGGQARSWDTRGYYGSGIRFVFGNNGEASEDSRLRKEHGRGKQLKVLAAKKVLVTQKEAGVSFTMKEGGIIDKLVDLEDKAVKAKTSRKVNGVVL